MTDSEMTNPNRSNRRSDTSNRNMLGARLSRRTLARGAAILGAAALAMPGRSTAALTRSGSERELASVRIYVLREDERRGPLMAVLGRVVNVTERRVATGAIRALLDGITEEERAIGLDTAIPAGVALRDATLDPATGVVRLDFTAAFVSDLERANVATATGAETPRVDPADLSDDPPDMLADTTPELRLRLRQAQVVHTVTQFETIRGAEFFVEGERLAVLDRDGKEIDGPATRDTFEDLSPFILVEDPVPFATVGSSFTARGTANTFEAAFSLRVLDANGATVFEQGYTATSGSGTRGTFEAPVMLPATLPAGEITLVAFEYSARDGSMEGVVEIPLTYAP